MIALRRVLPQCYSGRCVHCRIEIEAVAQEEGVDPTTECYPMRGEPIVFPPDDYDLYFPS